jgi:hypothetical protein
MAGTMPRPEGWLTRTTRDGWPAGKALGDLRAPAGPCAPSTVAIANGVPLLSMSRSWSAMSRRSWPPGSHSSSLMPGSLAAAGAVEGFSLRIAVPG